MAAESSIRTLWADPRKSNRITTKAELLYVIYSGEENDNSHSISDYGAASSTNLSLPPIISEFSTCKLVMQQKPWCEIDRKMGLFEGKKGLVLGIANNFSIAWAITQKLHEQGAEMAFTHLPDGERPKNENKVRKLVDPIGAKFVMPCDVCDDAHIEAVMEKTAA